MIVIDEICGVCPVQGYGTVGLLRFYFRACGKAWSISITPQPSIPNVEEDAIYYHSEKWGEGDYDAGYMPHAVARRIIRQQVDAFLAFAVAVAMSKPHYQVRHTPDGPVKIDLSRYPHMQESDLWTA